MREIKFRAWDKKFKEWACIGLKVGEGVLPIAIKDYVFMQFTGLLDKNGKEIYEGDIVKQSDDIGREVTFYDGCWMLKDHFALYDYNIENIEIIGNIYENIDLLN